VANGNPDFELTELPALERFYAPIADLLQAFAVRHGLVLSKYEKGNHSWDFLFRHPAGGVARVQVLEAQENAVHLVAHWGIADFNAGTRRRWSADRGVLNLMDPGLATVLDKLLREVLTLKVEDALPDGVDYRSIWNAEHIPLMRESEMRLPLPAEN